MKKYYKYILLFVVFFISLVFIFTISRGDTFVNYGFSYAISMGEIPYKDFNMIITPFGPIIYSLGLLFFNNIITFYLEQAFLLTVFFYYLEKLIGKKSILMLLIVFIPFPIAFTSCLFPGYNFLALLLLIMFIYYFKNNKNDYLLGILLGLIFCTKQTIGFVLFIPVLYYLFKDQKKFKKILVGYLIPILVLLLYLVVTSSLNSFINLCFLGLFDFNNHNNQIDIMYLIFAILGVSYFIYRIVKNKSNILLYFGLLFVVVIFPIIDYYHVSLFLVVVFYFLLENINVKDIYYKHIIVFIISICCIWSFITYQYFNPPVVSSYNHFYLVVNTKAYTDNSKKLIKYVKDKEAIYFMRGSENYFYKIVNNKKLDYFDLPNYGNYGYNGINMMKKEINNVHDTYFVLDSGLVYNTDKGQQYITELGKYVISKSTKIDNIGVYEIYYKE